MLTSAHNPADRPLCNVSLAGVMFLWAMVSPLFLLAADSIPKLTIQENTAQELRFNLSIPFPTFSQQKVSNQIYDVIQLEGFTLQPRPGAPALPTLSYTLILPPEGNPQISFVTSPGAQCAGKNLLPSLLPEVDAATDSVRYQLAQLPAEAAASLPVRLVETGLWRGFRLGRLEITPLQIAGQAMQFFSAIAVTIKFIQNENTRPLSFAPLNDLERLALKSALNFSLGQHWRRPATTTASETSQPFHAGAGAIKIAIVDDGYYSLSYRLLDSLGFNPGAMQPATLQIWNKGREIPMSWRGNSDDRFEPGEAIEFFGEKLSGESTFNNHYTLQNIYWLTSGAAPGKRFTSRTVPATVDPAPTTANYFWQWRHFEQEKTYYQGDNDVQIFSSSTAPGETWIWETLIGDQSFLSALALPDPVLTNAPVCSLRVHLRGTTVDPVTPSHHVRFSINNNAIGEVFFDDTEDIIFRAAFPSQWLNGSNDVFRLLSLKDTGAAINQIYLDWIEIGYWRQYAADENTLAFREPQNAAGAATLYRLGKLNSDQVWLFDRRHRQSLTGFAVTPAAANQFQIAFVDSAISDRDYFALTPSGRRTPVAIWVDSPSDWRSASNAADYILITPAEFREAAERLAQYRRQHSSAPAKDRLANLRVAVVQLEDIYDEFNFGIAAPEAIRAFLRHAYENWQRPAPTFVCFFGDASLDPNLYELHSSKRNFIFSFGNPASDNRLVCFDGPNDFLPEMVVGRLPIETPAQAEALVDKIIFYESAPIADWNKTFIFLNGGVDASEQQNFRNQSEALIAKQVLPAPISGRAVRIYKTTPGRVLGELRPEIFSALDAGALMLTFSGHAGSQTWELMVVNSDIADLRNRELYPFIASMTCHTARFANSDQNSFGEEFLRPPDKGAIAFWGTSGYGFVFQDGVLLDSLYTRIVRDTVRSVGVATTLAKIGLWKALGSFSINVNSIDQYTLLGDPALQLALPTAPDLAMTPANINLTPSAPNEDDLQVQLNVKVRNLGLATTDSVDVAIAVAAVENGQEKFRHQTRKGPIGWADSVSVSWSSRGSRGDYQIRAEVDRSQRIAESNEANNATERTVYFAPSTIALAAPTQFALLRENQPILRVYNPSTLAKGSRTYFFEIDTTADFNSPAKIISPAIAEARLRSSWQVPSSLLNRLYFWRSRTMDGDDAGPWQTASFWIEAQSTISGFRQAEVQLSSGIFDNTVLQDFAGGKKGVTLATGQKQGTFQSVEIGPARAWQTASINGQVPSGSLKIAVLGRLVASQAWQVVKENLTTPEIPLADIEAKQFPFLRLQADFRDDDGFNPPILYGWTVGFAPSSDFATGRQAVSVSADSVWEGETVRLKAEVFHFNNAPTASTETVPVIFSQFDPRAERGKRTLAQYNATMAPESSQNFTFDWPSTGNRGENTFFVEIDPDNQFVEPVEFNNIATLTVLVRADTATPRLEVTFDGHTVITGDYVSPSPEILCKIFDDSLLPIADTSRVQVYLNEERVAYAGAEARLQLDSFSAGPLRAQVTYRPQLTGGQHVIEFLVRDGSNNPAYYRAEVQVDTDFHLRDVMNYPNPFRADTDFTYYLTQPADEVTVKIFTISGRLIATLDHAPITAGFNRVHWDGRDADGEVLANGVYLYKLIAKLGERQLEEIQKCVVMR